jgi:hypothetical protein
MGTLGFRPDTILPTIRSTEGLQKVVVFHSDHARSREAVAEVRDICKQMGLEFTNHEVPDAFNFVRVSKAIQTEIAAMRAAGEALQVFNVAGGTRIMSACALLVCTLEGVNCVYVHDDTLEEIPLPMLQIRYSDVLTSVQRDILRYLLAHREEDITQKALGLAFALHKATVNHHIKELVSRGAVHLVPSPKDSRIKLIKVEESMELLLGRQ